MHYRMGGEKIMDDAEYIGRELRKALEIANGGEWPTDEDGEPKKIRFKAEGPHGSSRWLPLTVPEFEALIRGTVAKVAEREGR